MKDRRLKKFLEEFEPSGKILRLKTAEMVELLGLLRVLMKTEGKTLLVTGATLVIERSQRVPFYLEDYITATAFADLLRSLNISPSEDTFLVSWEDGPAIFKIASNILGAFIEEVVVYLVFDTITVFDSTHQWFLTMYHPGEVVLCTP